MIGYAMCGSFCTHARALAALRELIAAGEQVQPILSEVAYATDTRFGRASTLVDTLEALCGRSVIHTVEGAEPLGPSRPLEVLIIAPCTGNTLAKMAMGITDGAVTMAAKAHLRCDRPLLLALASNDAMSANLGNLGRMLGRRSVYVLPLLQDDPLGKPHSLVADFERIPEALVAAREGKQLRPLFLS